MYLVLFLDPGFEITTMWSAYPSVCFFKKLVTGSEQLLSDVGPLRYGGHSWTRTVGCQKSQVEVRSTVLAIFNDRAALETICLLLWGLCLFEKRSDNSGAR